MNYSVDYTDAAEHLKQIDLFSTEQEARKCFEEEIEKFKSRHSDYEDDWLSGWNSQQYPQIELNEADEEGLFIDGIDGWSSLELTETHIEECE